MTTAPIPKTHDAEDAPAVVGPPLFSVTKGNPTPEEIAALTAVIASVGAAPEPEEALAPTRRERIRQATLRPRHMINQRRGRV